MNKGQKERRFSRDRRYAMLLLIQRHESRPRTISNNAFLYLQSRISLYCQKYSRHRCRRDLLVVGGFVRYSQEGDKLLLELLICRDKGRSLRGPRSADLIFFNCPEAALQARMSSITLAVLCYFGSRVDSNRPVYRYRVVVGLLC